MKNERIAVTIGLMLFAVACSDAAQDSAAGTGPMAGAAGQGGGTTTTQASGGTGGQSAGGNGGMGGSGGAGGTMASDAGSDVADAPTEGSIESGTEGGITEGGTPAGCTAIHASRLTFDSTNSSNIASLFSGPLSVALGDPASADGVIVSIVSLDGMAVKKTGAFPLGVGVENNYETCEHCVVVVQDTTSTTTKKKFFPVSGTMNIDPSTPPSAGATTGIKGTLVDVKLIEVTIGPGPAYHSTPVPGGACVYFANEPLTTQ
jgi:hypothetical protein